MVGIPGDVHCRFCGRLMASCDCGARSEWDRLCEKNHKLEVEIKQLREVREYLSQKLADMPCPVCKDPTIKDGDRYLCGRCGGFPPDRRGHFAIDAEDALRRVSEMGKEE